MKVKYFLFLAFFIAYSSTLFSQSLNGINNAEDAEIFIANNPGLKAELLYYHSTTDSSVIAKQLLSAKKGAIIKSGKYSYKVISDSIISIYRVSYIYLDGNKISAEQIERIRKDILKKYKAGISFASLNKQYSMDGNPSGGDTGPFGAGMMNKIFEDEVKAHRKGDIFTLDIPDNKWYYVVKKTFSDQQNRELTVLMITNK